MIACALAVLVSLNAAEADPPAAWAPGGPSRGEDLIISFATFGPGLGVAYMGGHAALVVVDKKLEKGRLYNFGVVEFSPDLMWNFVLGRLDFMADQAGIAMTYDEYKALDRDVRVQVLDLTPEQALSLANALAVGVLPENRVYRYHHFDDNCSTRPRDLIDRALGGALSRENSGPARMSLRDHARRYTRVFPVLSFWLDYMQNDSVDRKITRYAEGFLPDELEKQLDALTVDGRPVVKQKTILYVSKTNGPPPAETPQWGATLAGISLAFGFVLLVLGFSRSARARKVQGLMFALVGVALGTSGLALFMLGTFTDHEITHRNENLFFVNPVTFLLLPLGIMLFKGRPSAQSGLKWVTSALAVSALAGIAVKLLPMFDQANWNVIAFVLPLSLLSAAATRMPGMGVGPAPLDLSGVRRAPQV